MKTNHILSMSVALIILASCSDDNNFGPGRQEGFLYFNPTESHAWANGNLQTRAAVEAPIPMECDLSGQAVYLHTEVTPTMSPQLEKALSTLDDMGGDSVGTRGIRYTNDVFSLSSAGSPKITNFGVYATRTSDRGIIIDYANIGPDGTDGYSGSNYDYPWNIKLQEIEDVWDSGSADFYGYAPYFNNTSNTNGLSMVANGSGVPTLTYTVPTDVTNQLDILTAKHLNVTKGKDVELEFTHVMAAIKFNFKHGKETTDGGSTWSEKDNFRWTDGVNTYNVTVKSIQIQNVYNTGTWEVGSDPYNGARWTRTSDVKASFTYDNVNKNLSGESSPVDLNPDADGNVFMMLPQQVPADAKIILTCNLTKVGDENPTKSMTLEAALKETDGSTPKTWLPGYTYTYTISLSDYVYVFDYNTNTDKTYNNVVYAGTQESDIFIRSYKMDSKGNKTNVEWEPQYYEIDADATGVGDNYGDVGSWKTGNNGWIRVFDHSAGDYSFEVKTNHSGAHEGESDDIRLFKIEISNINTPIMDLSLWNQDQTKRWRGRSTSNCYIVSGPGTYRIPLIYGNAWTNGKKNVRAYDSGQSASSNILGKFLNYRGNTINTPFIKEDVGRSTVANACLVWEEGDGSGNSNMGGGGSNEGTVIKVNPVIDTAVTGEDEYNTDNATAGTQIQCDYLQFEIKPDNFNYGNAVVGIRDELDNIIWSWHIWMIDAASFIENNPTLTISGNEITYANTNIGWVDGGRSIPALTREGHARLKQAESNKIITINATQQKRPAFETYFTNVLYQWGRKDPMRGITNTNQETTDNGAPRGTAGVQAYTNEYGNKVSVANAIKNPNKIYGVSRGDLWENVYYNLWASTLSKVYNTNGGTWIFYGKTIYDPSPVGYCVPPSKCLTKLTRSNFTEINHGVTLPIICDYVDGSTTLKFHASGCRSTSGGKSLHASGYHDPDYTDAANGFYHTATPYSNDESWQLHLYFYRGIDTHNFIRGDMCEALSVKPVLWDGEVVETEDVDQNNEYLTFTFQESGALYWQDSHAATTSRTISYSTNKGETWNTVTSQFSGSGTKIADVAAKTVVWVKGNNDLYCRLVGGVYYYQHFHSTASYSLSGNIMSLIYGDDFRNKTAFPDGSSFNFCSLFYDPEGVGNNNDQMEETDGLVLPATTLRESCYESMFQNCTKLVSAPDLPATNGVNNCYKNMFNGCSNLNTVKVMLTSPSNSYTSNWLSGVSSGGTFFYSQGATWTSNSASGIPSGWSSVPLD